ncbi:hypothetical protein MPTK1_5g21410 [Marchantia polymorpha subsp. ruderalis]
MAKNGAFNKMYLIVALVLLGLSSMAGAVDVAFFSNTGACTGLGTIRTGTSSYVCYYGNAGSIRFTGMNTCRTSIVYKGGVCNTTPYGGLSGNRCYIGGGFTSAYWYPSCRRRSLLDDVTSNVTKCDFKTTGLVFTEDSAKGTWILKSSNATQLMSQIENLTDVEKLTWFKAHGASFDDTADTQNVPLN